MKSLVLLKVVAELGSNITLPPRVTPLNLPTAHLIILMPVMIK